MDDLRSLREQRDELRGRLDAIMERNDSIDDIESIEALESGTAEMAELDKSIRSAEARAAYEESKKTVSGSYSFRSQADATPNRGDGEYRFVMDGSNVRIEGRAAEVGAPAANAPSASLPGMDLSTSGAYSAAIPVDLQAELIRKLPNRTVVRRFFSSMNYTNDIELQRVATRVAVEAIADHDGQTTANQVSVTDEGVTYSTVDMSLERVRTNNFKSAARSEVTEEFMRDARGRAVAELLLQHAESHGLLFDAWYAGGAGGTAGPEACWDGAEAYIPGAAGLAAGQVEQINMDLLGISATSTAADAAEEWTRALTNLRYGRIPAQYWGGLRWMFSQAGFAELTKQIDANGRPLFQPLLTGTAADSLEVGTLLGLPVFVGNNLPNADVTSGNTCCILAHAEDYRIFDRMPMSQQVDPYSAGDAGKVVYRTRMRSDGRWLRPFAAGMILWNDPA
jgi:HK97 family phage major capsid protein